MTPYLFLPNLQSIDIHVVLNVLEGSPEAIHLLGQSNQSVFKFVSRLILERDCVMKMFLQK